MTTKRFCDICKKEFDEWDEMNAFGMHVQPGYGSRLDGESVSIDLCCSCFDALVEKVLRPSVESCRLIMKRTCDAE